MPTISATDKTVPARAKTKKAPAKATATPEATATAKAPEATATAKATAPASIALAARKRTSPVSAASIKDMVLAALHHAGGENYLLRQAEEDPKTFMSLVAKVLPTQLEHSGGLEADVQIYKLPDNGRESA